MKQRIVIYMRLSKEDEQIIDESSSIINQRLIMAKYVSEHFIDYDMLEIYDDGYTGTNFNRPGITKLLNMAREEKVDCIVVKDFSRFSRDYIELGTYIHQVFPFLGIRFISIGDRYDSEHCLGMPAGIEQNFKSLVYDLYSKDLSVKVKTALKVRKEKGYYSSANAPFGYCKRTSNKHVLMIKEEEAVIVKRIFKLTIQGMSSVQIAKHFNEEGVKAPIQFKIDAGEVNRKPKGSKFDWSSQIICRILRNEAYTGCIVYGKYEKELVGGKNYLKPRNEWKLHHNAHEAIIDQKTFDIVQEGRGKTGGRKQRKGYPLTGRLICGGCGKSLTLRYGNRPYFCCDKRYSNGCRDCIIKMSRKSIEDLILHMLCHEFAKSADSDRWNREIKKRINDKINKVSAQIRQLKDKTAIFENEKKDAYEKYKLGVKNSDVFADELKAIKKRLEAEQEEINRLNEKKKDYEKKLLLYNDGIRILLLSKEIVEGFIKSIMIYDDSRVEIKWNFKSTIEI